MHLQSYDGAQDQENAPMFPIPFPSLRVGSGNKTTTTLMIVCDLAIKRYRVVKIDGTYMGDITGTALGK